MIKKPGVVYPYLGYNEELLDSRRTGRCAQTVDPGGDGERPAELDIGSLLNTAIGAGQPKVCRIDNTRGLVVYRGTSPGRLSAVVAQVNSDLTVTLGTPVNLELASSITNHTAVSHEDGKVLVVYVTSNSNEAKANVLTISGLTITVGAQNILFATTNFAGANVVSASNTSALLVYQGGSTPYGGSILTISGDTVTSGAYTAIDGASGLSSLDKISGSLALLVYAGSGASTGNHAIVVDYSSGITTGARLSINTWHSGAIGARNVEARVLPDASSAVVIANDGSNFLKVKCIGISGSSLTSDTDGEYLSAVTQTGTTKHLAVLGSRLTAVVCSDATNSNPITEGMLVSTSDITQRHTRTLLDGSAVISDIWAVRLSSTKLMWVATASGILVVQAFNMV